MRGLPLRWIRCPGCHRVIFAVPVETGGYAYGLHWTSIENTLAPKCGNSAQKIPGDVYLTLADVPPAGEA